MAEKTEKRIVMAAPSSQTSLAPRNNVAKSVKLVIVVGAIVAAVFVLVFAAGIAGLGKQQGNIALIKISGSISSGDELFGKAANPDEIITIIDRAEKSAAVKGILIEINSPGGSPVASEEIMKALKSTNKPTVAVIRDIGTSGAYWVASASDFVVASPVSITGSVGVTGSYLEFSQLLQRYGVRYERLVSAEHKDIGSPYRNLTEEEKVIAEEGLAKMHSYFLSSVKENRKITDTAAIEKISAAIIFLGSEAKQLGLVDALGGKKEAEEWLKQQTNLTEIKYVTYEKKPLFDIGSLLAEQSAAAGSALAKSALAAIFKTTSFQGFR